MIEIDTIVADPPKSPDPQPKKIEEPTTKIKPSEAIKLGRLEYPDMVPHSLFSEFSPFSACTIGAMYIGYGGNRDDARARGNTGYAIDYILDAIRPNLPNELIDYILNIPSRFDGGNLERDIIAELEAMGY